MIMNRSGLPTYHYLVMNRKTMLKKKIIPLAVYIYRVDPAAQHPIQHRLGEELLKRSLAQEGITEYDLRRTKKGKPTICAPMEDPVREICYVSISHTDGFVVCAISKDRPVGVDGELPGGHRLSNSQMRRTEKKLLKKEFEPEGESLRQAADQQEAADRTRRFCERWTLAEAFGKMKGVGLAFSDGYDEIVAHPHETRCIDEGVVTVLAEGNSDEYLQVEWTEVRKNDGNFLPDYV